MGAQLQECTGSTCSYAHQSHVYWTAGVTEVCPKQVASSGDSVIQFWLCQCLEVMGTAGMGRLNRGIGVDRTGHCMEESNRYSMISILYPQRNCTINFFPHHHYGIGVNLLKQCFKKCVKKKKGYADICLICLSCVNLQHVSKWPLSLKMFHLMWCLVSVSPLSHLFSPNVGILSLLKSLKTQLGMLQYVIHQNMSHALVQIFYCRFWHKKGQVLRFLKYVSHSHKWEEICTQKLGH